MAQKLKSQLQGFRLAILRIFGKMNRAELPPLFTIDDRACEWKGEISRACCAITGQRSFMYDVFRNEHGEPALVSAGASRKIQDFIRNRESQKFTGPMEFVVYGVRVRIVDHRTWGKARAIQETGSGEASIEDAAIA